MGWFVLNILERLHMNTNTYYLDQIKQTMQQSTDLYEIQTKLANLEHMIQEEIAYEDMSIHSLTLSCTKNRIKALKNHISLIKQ